MRRCCWWMTPLRGYSLSLPRSSWRTWVGGDCAPRFWLHLSQLTRRDGRVTLSRLACRRGRCRGILPPFVAASSSVRTWRRRRHSTDLSGVLSHTFARMCWFRPLPRLTMRQSLPTVFRCRANCRLPRMGARRVLVQGTLLWSWVRCRGRIDVGVGRGVLGLAVVAVSATFVARWATSSGSARRGGVRRQLTAGQKTRRRGIIEPRATGQARSGDYYTRYDQERRRIFAGAIGSVGWVAGICSVGFGRDAQLCFKPCGGDCRVIAR